MTLRLDDGLAAEVRRAARRDGRSVNAWVAELLRVAVDPEHDAPGMERVRERLRRAGVLAVVPDRPVARPDPQAVAAARAEAGRGRPVAEFVVEGRR